MIKIGLICEVTYLAFALCNRSCLLTIIYEKWEETCSYHLLQVRYQSRKKLAEQRPRVRGQFVRQGPLENKGDSTVS